MAFLPEKLLELQILKLVCIYDFPLGVIWWVPLGHISSFPCVRLKKAKSGISAKTIEPRELDQ